MNSTETGRKAEAAARVYLEMRGYQIIVVKKDGAIYFAEVKYRFNDEQGGGLEAITKSMLKQMQYAANTWIDEHKWAGPSSLAAVEIAGKDFVVMGFIDNVY